MTTLPVFNDVVINDDVLSQALEVGWSVAESTDDWSERLDRRRNLYAQVSGMAVLLVYAMQVDTNREEILESIRLLKGVIHHKNLTDLNNMT